MKRININLHPSRNEEADKIYKLVSQYIPYVFLGLVGLVFINILLFLLASFARLSYKASEGEWKKLSPQVESITALKKEVDTLALEHKEYKKIFSGHVKTAKMLADIFSSLPKNIWLEQIDFQTETVNFSGYVVRWKEDYLMSLDKFVKNLSASKYFSAVFKDINLTNSRKSTINGVEVVRFLIECKK